MFVIGWQHALRGIERRWLKPVVAVTASLVVAQLVLLPAILALDATNRPRPQSSGRTPADVGIAYRERESRRPMVFIWRHGGSHRGTAPPSWCYRGRVRRETTSSRTPRWWHAKGTAPCSSIGEDTGQRRPPQRIRMGGRPRRPDGCLVGPSSARRDEGRRSARTLDGRRGRGDGRGRDPRVAAVVAEGVSVRTFADARLRPHGWAIPFENEWLMFGLVGLLGPQPQPQPLVDAFTALGDRPVLLIAGNAPPEAELGPGLRSRGSRQAVTFGRCPTPAISRPVRPIRTSTAHACLRCSLASCSRDERRC